MKTLRTPLDNSSSTPRRQTRQAAMMSNTGAPSSSRSTPGADWLPPARLHNPLANKVLRRGNVQAQKHRDWFLALASAVEEQRDGLQSKMLTKFYLFLRDFLPHGLTGAYGHIHGNEVMNQLLCHFGESTVSRHKVTKHADTVLTELQEWMGKHKSWQDALKQARAGSNRNADRNKTDKKRTGGRAPGLHTPAAIIAVLTIAHPDPEAKFRSWIGRLQIDWMVKARETLDVKEGFWKGLNNKNLYTVFDTDDEVERRAAVELMADYDRVFGADFVRCRRDIRPYLPAHLVDRMAPLTEAPSDVEDEGSNQEPEIHILSSDQDSRPPSAGDNGPTVAEEHENEPADASRKEALRFRTQLNEHTSTQDELERWLIAELSCGDEILRSWCVYWEDRIDRVTTHSHQMLTRSLFMHSLHRLRSLSNSAPELASAFMLVDMAEVSRKAPAADEVAAAREALVTLGPFSVCDKANQDFIRLVGDSGPSPKVRAVMDRMFQQQVLFFCNFTQNSPFFGSWEKVFALEALYTSMVSQGQQNPVMALKEVQSWQSRRDSLLSAETISLLELTSWQVRALLLPGSERTILTDWQEHIFRESQRPVYPSILSQNPRQVVGNDLLYPATIERNHKSLHKLFGEVNPPNRSVSPEAEQSNATTPAPPPAPSFVRPTGHQRSASPVQDEPNPFAGMACLKRAGSPLASARSQKVSRLGAVVTRDALSQELHDATGQLKDNMHTQLAGYQDDLRKSLPSALQDVIEPRIRQATEGVINALDARHSDTTGLSAALQTTLEPLLQSFKDEVFGEMAAVRKESRDMLIRIEKQNEDAIADIKKQNQDFVNKLQVSRAALQEQKDAFFAMVQDLQIKPQGPGSDGYLAQCEAPAGWSRGQQQYEHMLIRAAWFYINLLGTPEDSAGGDEEAWDSMKATFPGLKNEHLIKALNHAHMQGYGRLFDSKQ